MNSPISISEIDKINETFRVFIVHLRVSEKLCISNMGGGVLVGSSVSQSLTIVPRFNSAAIFALLFANYPGLLTVIQ